MFHQHDPSLSLYRIDDLCFKIYDFSFLLKIFDMLGSRTFNIAILRYLLFGKVGTYSD